MGDCAVLNNLPDAGTCRRSTRARTAKGNTTTLVYSDLNPQYPLFRFAILEISICTADDIVLIEAHQERRRWRHGQQHPAAPYYHGCVAPTRPLVRPGIALPSIPQHPSSDTMSRALRAPPQPSSLRPHLANSTPSKSTDAKRTRRYTYRTSHRRPRH